MRHFWRSSRCVQRVLRRSPRILLTVVRLRLLRGAASVFFDDATGGHRAAVNRLTIGATQVKLGMLNETVLHAAAE